MQSEIIQSWTPVRFCQLSLQKADDYFRHIAFAGSMYKMIIRCPDDEDLEIQFIRQAKMLELDPMPDFDMNVMSMDINGSLVILPCHEDRITVPLKDITKNTMRRKTHQLKRVEDMRDERRQIKMLDRISKMKQRGFETLN